MMVGVVHSNSKRYCFLACDVMMGESDNAAFPLGCICSYIPIFTLYKMIDKSHTSNILFEKTKKTVAVKMLIDYKKKNNNFSYPTHQQYSIIVPLS